MSAIHQAKAGGFLLLNGKPPSIDDIAGIAGKSPEEVAPIMDELLSKGVLKRDRKNGPIYWTRMVRDAQRSDKSRTNGQLGGNPNLKPKAKGDNPRVNRRVNPTLASSILASSPIPEGLDTEQFRAAWGEWEQHKSECRNKLTPTAAKRLLAKLGDMGHDRAVAAIMHSIAQGWKGVYEPKGDDKQPDTFKTIQQLRAAITDGKVTHVLGHAVSEGSTRYNDQQLTDAATGAVLVTLQQLRTARMVGRKLVTA